MNVCDVTVVIPNFNRTQVLRRALQSVVRQTVLPREVVIIDDCSSSDVFAEIQDIVAEFSGKLSLNLLRNEFNGGANYCRNRGIFAAKGKFIAFLDSDDLWLPEKLERQVAEIQKLKSVERRPVLSGTGRYRVDERGNIIARQFGGGSFTSEKIRRSNFVGTLSSVMVETSIAKQIGGFEETLPACQDWEFFIRLSDYVAYVGVPDPLCIYVDHGGERITRDNRRRIRALMFMYKQHIRPFVPAGRRHELYRTLAEDFQGLGLIKTSARFYAKSFSVRYFGTGCMAKLAEWGMRQYFRFVPPSPIKKRRYETYGKMLAKEMQNPERRREIEKHQIWLHHHMAGSSI